MAILQEHHQAHQFSSFAFQFDPAVAPDETCELLDMQGEAVIVAIDYFLSVEQRNSSFLDSTVLIRQYSSYHSRKANH